MHTFNQSLAPYFCPRFSSKTPWLRRGRFRKLSFNTERASARAAESETDEPELDISSRLGRRGRGHTLALDALRSTDRVQSEREERQGVGFYVPAKRFGNIFCRFLVVSEWSPSDSTDGHATPCFFSTTLADLGKNNRLHLIDRMPSVQERKEIYHISCPGGDNNGGNFSCCGLSFSFRVGDLFCGAKYLCLTPTHGQASLNYKLYYF